MEDGNPDRYDKNMKVLEYYKVSKMIKIILLDGEPFYRVETHGVYKNKEDAEKAIINAKILDRNEEFYNYKIECCNATINHIVTLPMEKELENFLIIYNQGLSQ